MGLFVLKGIDEISRYIEFNSANIMDWIFFCDFPTKKINGVWVARKSDIKKCEEPDI